MKDNINALDEIHKGACMGKDAIGFVINKVTDRKFKAILQKQYDDYEIITKRIDKLYSKYTTNKPHSTNIMTKAMTWSDTQLQTLNDHSNSKIADMLLQGLNMGIIEGKKILNNKKITSDVSQIINKFVSMQENSVNVLKKYL